MAARTWIAGGAVALVAALAGCERQSWDTVKEFHRHHGAHDAHGDAHGADHGAEAHPASAPDAAGHGEAKPGAKGGH